jgi:hypothetical protein
MKRFFFNFSRHLKKMLKLKKSKKNFFECSIRNQYKQKALILKKSEELSEFCRSFGLKINELILAANDENPTRAKISIKVPRDAKSVTFDYMKAKDLTNMSNHHYCQQRSQLLNVQKMPGIKKILKLQYELNDFFEINNNNFGFFCSPEQKIKFVCEKFLDKKKSFSCTSFKIKLSIDSTSISKKNVILLNVSFNLMDDHESSSNVNGTFILGSFEIEKEDYDNVKKSLSELLLLLEPLSQINIKGRFYQIIFFLGCDYKMIRILYGQQASNAIKG